MIYFIYGEDSYRSKRKLGEIIDGYKKVHKSGLNLIYVDAKQTSFNDFYSNFKITSMFAEKKLIILENVFGVAKASTSKEEKEVKDSEFQKELLENIKGLEEIKDIIVIYEDKMPDKRTKLFKSLIKQAKCQESAYLQPAALKSWVVAEFTKNKVRINYDAIDLLISFVKNDLWQMENEINKLSNYRSADCVTKADVELLVKPNIENEIFKTIDALASKDKKQALFLLHKHIEDGDAPLYLLSMVSYQFKNLLIIKELQDAQNSYPMVVKKSGIHPFVAQKSYYLCNQFSSEKLKKIYQKIFQIDLDIKVGKIEPELALDLLISEI